MNLITETKGKLAYSEATLIDLQECVEQPVTKDCLHYLNDQLDSTKKRIQYYSELLEALEKVNLENLKKTKTSLLIEELITRENVKCSKGNTSIAITVKNIVEESGKSQ